MKTTLIFILLIGLTLGVQFNNRVSIPESMANITGNGINSTLGATIIDVVNNAYHYFRSDLKLNTDYIKTQLDKIGTPKFNVVIIPSENVIPSLTLRTFNDTYLAWIGVNQEQKS